MEQNERWAHVSQHSAITFSRVLIKLRKSKELPRPAEAAEAIKARNDHGATKTDCPVHQSAHQSPSQQRAKPLLQQALVAVQHSDRNQ